MIYKPSQEDQALIYVKKCFERKQHLKIEPIQEAKTLPQNRYIWLICTIVGHDTGNDKQDIYDYWIDKFPTYNEIELFGETKLVRITLSQFSDVQARVFIDKIIIDATQEGHVIPDPKDKAALEAYNYYRKLGLL